jgi:hypothetical protein
MLVLRIEQAQLNSVIVISLHTLHRWGTKDILLATPLSGVADNDGFAAVWVLEHRL